MDVGTITTLISSLGFPIVVCIFLGWYVKDLTDKSREDTKELNRQHNEEMMAFKEELKEALNNNTIAFNRLCDKLDSKELIDHGKDE